MNPKLVIITSFPPKGMIHDKAVVGIASYAKNTLLGIKQYKKDVDMVVLAENLGDGANKYEDEGMEIRRIWKRGTFSIFFNLLKEIFSLKSTKHILIEFEVSMFGDFLYLLPFPIFLLILKMMGKKTFVVSHQVINDINDLGGHINLKGNIYPHILNLLISIFYRFTLLLATKVIVFDWDLKQKLAKHGNPNKIKIIPHGVQSFNQTISKEESREKLNLNKEDFVLLYFGYLAWYKGTDWLIDSFKQIKNDNQHIKLIIAGGPNPNHLNKKYYQKYIRDIEQKCQDQKITLTGFVMEKEIPLYFQASDVVILPYRTLMSASGPLSIAFSFSKPFLVSDKLSGIMETDDIKKELLSLDIDKNDLQFTSEQDLQEKIEGIKNDNQTKTKLEQLSKNLAVARGWQRIGQSYYEELFN